MNIYCCCSHKVNKLVEIKMDLETWFQMLIKVNKYASFLIWILMVIHKLSKKVVYIQTNWYILLAEL